MTIPLGFRLINTDLEALRRNLGRTVLFRFEGKCVLYDPITAGWMRVSVEDLNRLKKFVKDGLVDKHCRRLLVGLISRWVGPNVEVMMREFLPMPKVYYFELTRGCNLVCRYCYISASPKMVDSPTLPLEKWLSLIDEIAQLGGKEIVLTGGEPLLRYNDVLKISRRIKEKGLYSSLITNGTLLNRSRCIELSKWIDHVTLSIDSHIPSLNKYTRGFSNVERILRAAAFFIEQGVKVSMNVVVTRVNLDTIMDTVRKLQDIGIDLNEINLIVMSPVGRGAESRDLSINPKELIRRTIEYNLARGTLPNYGVEAFSKGVFRYVCGASVSEIYISSTGDVYPCRMLVDKRAILGNVEKSPLSIIMENRARIHFV